MRQGEELDESNYQRTGTKTVIIIVKLLDIVKVSANATVLVGNKIK